MRTRADTVHFPSGFRELRGQPGFSLQPARHVAIADPHQNKIEQVRETARKRKGPPWVAVGVGHRETVTRHYLRGFWRLCLPSAWGEGARAVADDQAALPPVSERARQVHAAGMLFDGHNDLPWRLRTEGDFALTKFDLSQRLDSGQTDIPRLREGGVKAQFWSVYIPSEHPNPARTVTEQIDLVHRMVEHYQNVFEMAYSADDVERITRKGKIASLIGIEGGVAIENSLAQLRAFLRTRGAAT